MKNIYVEGIQGLGKSTLVNSISNLFPELYVCSTFLPLTPYYLPLGFQLFTFMKKSLLCKITG